MMIFSDIGVPDTFINLGPDTQGLASTFAWMNFLLVLVAFGFLLIFVAAGYILLDSFFLKKYDEEHEQKMDKRFGFIAFSGIVIAVLSIICWIFVSADNSDYSEDIYEVSGVVTKVLPVSGEIYIDGFDDSLHMKNIPVENFQSLIGEKETFHCVIDKNNGLFSKGDPYLYCDFFSK